MIAHGVTFYTMWPLVTLTKVKITVFTWKSENIHLTTVNNISDTIYSKVNKHGQRLACEKTLKMMCHLMTLIFSPLFDNFWQFLRHYWWTLDSRVLAIHCAPCHRNVGLVLSLSLQVHYMWLRIGLQLDRLSSSVGREQVQQSKGSGFESGLLL